MLGKLIDGRLVVAGRIIKEGNTTITNPTEEKLKELGYKPIDYAEKPTYNREEEKLVERYTEQVDVIVVDYDIVALTTEEHNAVIQAEIVAEENKITARSIREGILGDNFATQKLTEIESNIYQLRQKLKKVEANEE